MRASARPAALQLCRDAIEHYLGADALTRFEEKREAIRERFTEFKETTGLDTAIDEALKIIDEQNS